MKTPPSLSSLRRASRLALTCALLVALELGGAGCTSHEAGESGGNAGTGSTPDEPLVAGKKVELSLSEEAASELDALSKQLKALEGLTPEQLLAKHEVEHVSTLGYDPSTAEGLGLIQASSIKLDDEEQAILKKHGFVISERQQVPHMLYGYDTLYQADLPVYVSADSILDAVHRSYDKMLSGVEQSVLIPQLIAMLDGMRTELASRAPSGDAAKDADFFLAVAKSLVAGQTAEPVFGADASEIASFVEAATKADGHQERVIFGAKRDIDFSQFEPRGHYTDSEVLEKYFRAMIWLGRTDLRLIETLDTGEQVFRREQLETMVLLRELVTEAVLTHWTRIDTTVETFVGKSDYMRLPEVDLLLADLGAKGIADLSKLSDQKIAQAIIDGRYGEQLIASQLIVNESPDGKTLPLHRSFALFGQRFTVDSQVFSNVVYDRVQGRMMPDPLDAAFAALGNDQAAAMLKPELEKYPYATHLEAMRTLIDAHDADFWNANLYNLWLTALRGLSPKAAAESAGLPTIARTEAWGRRILSTQLASWSQLRHDTVLYVKQSYTSGVACEFPDAYVDPYPEFFSALVTYAQRGAALADVLSGGSNDGASDAIREYFEDLESAMKTLGEMAEAQRIGQPFSEAQMAFINDIVHEKEGATCGGPPVYDGWYADLVYGAAFGITLEPTIADVHTQPTDEAGEDVGRILHVGTGLPRLMVVTIDTCMGPRAYAGVASSYYERVTEDWKRLTDIDWEGELKGGKGDVPDVEWTKDFVAGAK